MQKKILVLVSNPKGTASLNLLPEIRDLQEALQRSQNQDQFKVEWRVAVQQDDLRRHILDIKPQIIHFCGHGTEQGLVLEDDTGQAKTVTNEVLTSLLKIFADYIECVLLNACESENLAVTLSQYLNYVIGMNREVRDDAAIAFAEGFYDTLGAGESYERAFEVGKHAVFEKMSLQTGTNRKLEAIDLGGKPITTENQAHLIPVLKINPNPNPIQPWLSLEVNRDETFDEGFCFDVYISYVDKDPDTTWVWDVLVSKLEEAGLRVAVSGDSERPGVARVVNIEQGIQQSKRTVVVLSENYLSDNMAEFENTLGQTMGIQEGTYRLLPVKATNLDSSRLPTRLSMLTILDLSHPQRAEREFKRLLKALQSPLPKIEQ
jgi:hypothetical protein